MAKVGIFWVYKGVVFGKARPFEEGEEGVKGIVDSPDNHIDVWESDEGYTCHFPELSGVEYQQIPRGRALFQRNGNKHVIYLDKTLNNETSRKLIAAYFGFHESQAQWRSDLHYTTAPDALDEMFSNED